nr:LpqN/LpqT family lipoprotein [Mycobacterium sp.]
MNENARPWRVLIAGTAAGFAGVLVLAGPAASAEPPAPQPSPPSPATVTQTVTVAPQAAPAVPGPSQPVGAAAVPVAAPRPVTVPLSPNPAGTIRDYLSSVNVQMEPQTANNFTALNIVLPRPTGWTQVPDPNVTDAFAVIADRVGGDGLYTSNAQVVVYKLVGDFDAREAIRHGFVDNQQLTAWRATDGSIAEINGVPTSIIEGTYRENNMTLNTSKRHIIATSGTDRYLVSLAVTTAESQSVAAAAATDAIVNGFRVATPAPVAAPAPAGLTPPGGAGAPAAPAGPATVPVSLSGTSPVAALAPAVTPVIGLPG